MAELPVLVDCRAALLDRPGGWERTTRELVRRTRGRVDTTPDRVQGPLAARWWEWTALPRLAHSAELVHFPAFPPTPTVRGRVVYTLHDLTWWRYPAHASRGGRWYYSRLAAVAVRRAHLVTVSHAVAAEIHDRLGVPADRITVIHPGVDRAERAAGPERRQRPYLLAVGTVEPRKNLARLLDGFARSGLSGRVDLLLVGRSGWGRVPAGAEHLGAVSDERLGALYAGALALVAVSTYEGFGLPVAEAFGYGCRVVCSDIPAFREVAGDAALYCDPLDADSIAAALRRAAAGDLPPARSVAQLSWDGWAQGHVDLWERLLGAAL